MIRGRHDDAIGRPLRYEELPREAAPQAMLSMMPPPVADMLLTAYGAAVGLPASVTSTVAEVTGTRARSFDDWAREHVAAFTAVAET